ncbi:hypothetical protein BD769DRAFT_1719709 [Suillus cothurnatus]|nr:hypothetical protein BD769DRAFT_1719709 [Suillus cothurnatus]
MIPVIIGRGQSTMGENLSRVIVAAFERYTVSNPLHPDVFPAICKMKAEIISMIVPATAHAAFDEGALYMKVKVHLIPVDPVTRAVHTKCVRSAISFIVLFLEKAGFSDGEDGGTRYKLSPLDFRYGFALKGSSVIMYRDAAFSASSDRWRLCQPKFVKLPTWCVENLGNDAIHGIRTYHEVVSCMRMIAKHHYKFHPGTSPEVNVHEVRHCSNKPSCRLNSRGSTPPEAISRAIKEFTLQDAVDVRYGHLLALVDLCNRFLTVRFSIGSRKSQDESTTHIAKIMLEFFFVSILNCALTEVDLNYPNVRCLVTSILRPMENLIWITIKMSRATEKAKDGDDGKVSQSVVSEDEDEDEKIDMDDDDRKETPDLYITSALGMFRGVSCTRGETVWRLRERCKWLFWMIELLAHARMCNRPCHI